MNGVVIDASTALAWCFPDEANAYADAVLVALEGKTILVPAVWSLEVANALLVGERRKRLRQAEIRRFTALLRSLPIVQDTQSIDDNICHVLPIAREQGLSAYDAAYLELSIRHGAALASLDEKLEKAASKAGVTAFVADAGR